MYVLHTFDKLRYSDIASFGGYFNAWNISLDFANFIINDNII